MFTTVPLPAEGSSSAARQGQGRKTYGTGVWLGSPQADWWWLCGRRGLRRGRGGAPAGARFPARLEAGKFNTWPWKLLWGLGKRLEPLAGGGSQRRCELTEVAAAMAGGGRRARPRHACAVGRPTAPRQARARCVARGLTSRGDPWRCVWGRRTPSARPDFKARPWYGDAQRRRGGDAWNARARATSHRRVPVLGPWHVPLFICTVLQKLQVNFKIRR
jgi:hypothetical protein